MRVQKLGVLIILGFLLAALGMSVPASASCASVCSNNFRTCYGITCRYDPHPVECQENCEVTYYQCLCGCGSCPESDQWLLEINAAEEEGLCAAGDASQTAFGPVQQTGR
jgi:hypothetical protein